MSYRSELAIQTAAHADREAETGHLIQVAIDAAIKETLADLRDRLLKANRELAYIRSNSQPLSVERLDGKIAGVRLALSYVDEALHMARPAEEATR